MDGAYDCGDFVSYGECSDARADGKNAAGAVGAWDEGNIGAEGVLALERISCKDWIAG